MSEIAEMTVTGRVTDPMQELVNEAYKCLECGKCTGSCPMVELFPNDFHPHHLLQELVRDPERALAGHDLWLCASCYKCNRRCPQAVELPYIFMNMRKLALKRNGKAALKKAYKLISEKIPFPSSFLSVCIHPERIDLDPVFIANLHMKNLQIPVKNKFPDNKHKVAIAGSGPAGLMSAYELRKMGYGITVFESRSVAGGMFSLAIPDFRIPLKIVQDEIKILQKMGIEFRLNSRVGEGISIGQLFKEGYMALLLAVGAHGCKKLDIQGEDFEGVYNTLEFLCELKIHKKNVKNKKVIVIGGGNTAMDSASSAMRLGAREAILLYRRTREEMPADINEIREAEHDGVQIRFLEAPLSIMGEKSKVTGLECIKMELGKPDMTGRRRPVPVEGTNFTEEADIVVEAIGEQPDTLPFKNEITTGRGNTILINPFSMETSRPGVFAAGDSVLGPATVADAIIGAKRAATGINNYIQSP